MHAGTTTYDLVVAADVFIYMRNLSPAFHAVRKVLRDGGIFCFSVELATAETTEFQLLPSLRYAHAESYLREIAALHGFEVIRTERGPIRYDQRQPIDGLFMFLATAAP